MSVHHHGLLKCSPLEVELRGWLSSSRPFGKPRCTAAQRIFLKSNWSRHPSCMRAFLPFRKYMNRIKRTQIIVFMKDTYQGPLLLQVGDDRVWISRLFRILAPPCEYFYILAPPCEYFYIFAPPCGSLNHQSGSFQKADYNEDDHGLGDHDASSMMKMMILNKVIRRRHLEENAETKWQRDEDEKPGYGKEDPAAHADAGHKVGVWEMASWKKPS